MSDFIERRETEAPLFDSIYCPKCFAKAAAQTGMMHNEDVLWKCHACGYTFFVGKPIPMTEPEIRFNPYKDDKPEALPDPDQALDKLIEAYDLDYRKALIIAWILDNDLLRAKRWLEKLI